MSNSFLVFKTTNVNYQRNFVFVLCLMSEFAQFKTLMDKCTKRRQGLHRMCEQVYNGEGIWMARRAMKSRIRFVNGGSMKPNNLGGATPLPHLAGRSRQAPRPRKSCHPCAATQTRSTAGPHPHGHHQRIAQMTPK